jgi:4-hydroxyproline epimerase
MAAGEYLSYLRQNNYDVTRLIEDILNMVEANSGGRRGMTGNEYRRVRVIDSHTGGEPTRLVISGGPDLGSGSLSGKLECFGGQHDDFRSAVVNEPRGSDVMVGALLCQPVDAACAAGVIFFNNVGYLGMCGHGTIGVIASLA